MKSKQIIFTLSISIIILLLVALAMAHQEEPVVKIESTTPMITVTMTHTQTETTTQTTKPKTNIVRSFEIRLPDQTRNGLPRDRTQTRSQAEHRYTGKSFQPDTIYVNQGDTVNLFLANQNNIYFTIPSLGIEERLNHGLITFKAEHKGSFEYICLDCDPHIRGLIYVY
ncbi:hypothetical protein CMO92_00575 [Candidatus Woesearchaeota archaeon]|nr:hypothetical protein [Candidatus Woesearchaeota archaeon]